MIPKVTVVVPVYNAQEHIGRCCHSLFSQTINELEIIFVDDYSQDDSVEIIKSILNQYPSRKPWVKIVSHEHNLGVGAARLTGNSHARGQYIIHCDADDFADCDMYRRMYDAAQHHSADIVICDYICRGRTMTFDTKNVDKPTFDISPIEGAVWNKLVRRSLIEQFNITFSPDLILGEDFLYVTQCRLLAHKVVHLPLALYHYSVDNNESITHHFNEQKCLSIVTVAKRMEEFLIKHDLSDRLHFELNYLKYQAKSFYLIFPETRDLSKYKSLFRECEIEVARYPIASYRRICSKLIHYHLWWIALVLLKIKDLRSR